MKVKSRMKRVLLAALAALMLAALSGCAGQTSAEDLNDATLGILTGAVSDEITKQRYPDAEKLYFNQYADLMLALQQGKIDGFVTEYPVLAAMQWEVSGFAAGDEVYAKLDYGFPLSEETVSSGVADELNAYIAEITANGVLGELESRWFSDTEPQDTLDLSALSGERGTLSVATNSDNRPFAYVKNAQLTGFDIELMYGFCKEYGYAMELTDLDFDSILPGIVSGKFDIGASGFTATDERRESVAFSDAYYAADIIMVLRDEGGGEFTSLSDFEQPNARIGVLTGSSYVTLARERFPEAEQRYYNIVPDMIVSVEQGKIDGFLCDSPYIAAMMWEGANVKTIEQPIAETEAAFVLSVENSDSALLKELNGFILALKEDGTLERLEQKWLGGSEPREHPDYSGLSGENGTLKLAIAVDTKPITYTKNDRCTGYEVELLTLFAERYGYALDFEVMNFDAILPGVVAGKYDIGVASFTVTEERAESITFTEPHLTMDAMMVVKGDGGGSKGFLESMAESFEKTFIREDRWKLIVDGIGITLLISVCSAAGGSALGFGVYMLTRAERKFPRKLARAFARVYSELVAGTPIVVILMVLFYVVFGSVDISGIPVAIIGFSLTFGAFVCDHLTVCVGNIDVGQTEAAYTLGYTRNRTFFRFILPQAMRLFLPSYCGEIVSLVKSTSVVGYVAVNDLTKMGDIIRSNTYEAFFPLIAVAVIYFLLTRILAALLGLVKLRFEPKRRSRDTILKGVSAR